MAEYDLLIKDGLVIDGTGAPGRRADVAVSGGRIVEISDRISGLARQIVEAEGHIVTPGFIDIHTHFDGQATWDDRLDPAFGHGVTTVVMGNCGVGFAPVRPGRHPELIDIMEGVEDIPGTALYEAMPWGAWETYPEYLDHLRSRRFALDVGSQIAHGALRAYVMGAEDIYQKLASDAQVEQMAQMVREAMRAGALGLSANRIMGHRSLTGDQVPGTFASEAELTALAQAMGQTGAGVFQMIPSGTLVIEGLEPDPHPHAAEIAMMGRISRASGRPITYTLFQISGDPDAWRRALNQTDAENAAGARLRPQVIPRQPGLLMSLGGYHAFMRRETYLKLRELPFERRLAELRKPEVKAAILADRDVPDDVPGSTETFITTYVASVVGRLFPLGLPVNYEPESRQSVAGVAAATGRGEEDVLYDMFLECDGTNVVMLADTNFVGDTFEAAREMYLHPSTVAGLSDAGAHVKFTSDASTPTYTLSYFVRDRTRGPRIPLEAAVAKLSAGNADLYGLADRGRIAPGLRADLNVIDLTGLRLDLPTMVFDLPKGSGRILQPAHGYKATVVNGVVTRLDDEDTGQRPGRLVTTAAADISTCS